MTKLLRWGILALLLLGLGLPQAHAQVCLPPPALTKTQAAVKYLRRLSLDLRGRVPSYGELNAVVKRGYVDDATIDAMLANNRFITEMREYHKDLLTLNITDLLLGTARGARYYSMNAKGEKAKAGETAYITIDKSSTAVQVLMRGGTVGCLNEAVRYDSQKRMLCKLKTTGKYIPCMQAYYNNAIVPQNKKVIAQEGFVMVQPYWESDPTKKVRVCGMTAQTAATSTYSYIDKGNKARSIVYNCNTGINLNKGGRNYHTAACGCGPRLNWCMRLGENIAKRGYVNMGRETLESMMEQTMRFIDDIVRTDKPYTHIITGKNAEINGRISHLVNHKTSASNRLTMPSKTDMTVPNLAYNQSNVWRPYTRGARDAGVLTLPFYTLKYATNRGRLHRFYTAFLCKHFTPPAGGLPDPADKCHDQPNLMKRCGCSHCHTTVEPGAAYWGRWQENAWFPILEAAYKDVDPLCQGKDAYKYKHCKILYLYAPKHKDEQPFKGHLLANVFATAAMKTSVKQGPGTLAQIHIKSGEVAACGVNKMYKWFVGQDLQKEQTTLKTQLVQDFQNSSYSVKKLVRAIVTSKEYRRGFDSNKP